VGNKFDRQTRPQEQLQQRLHSALPRHLKDLVQAASERGVTLVLLPQGMSLRRANRSHYNRKASHIVWSVRVRFGNDASVLSMFPDNVTILHIVSSLLSPSHVATANPSRPHDPDDDSALRQHRQPQRVKRLPGLTAYALAGWAALPLQDLGVFLRLQAPATMPLYKRIEHDETLQQVKLHASMLFRSSRCLAGVAWLHFDRAARNVCGTALCLGSYEHRRFRGGGGGVGSSTGSAACYEAQKSAT
jgi:hypothetical protein